MAASGTAHKNYSAYQQNILSPTAAGGIPATTKAGMSQNYNSTKAYTYLQKKGNTGGIMSPGGQNGSNGNIVLPKNVVNANVSGDFHGASSSQHNLIRRISSGRKSGMHSESHGTK